MDSSHPKTFQTSPIINQAKEVLKSLEDMLKQTHAEFAPKLDKNDLVQIASLKSILKKSLESDNTDNLSKIIKEIDDFIADIGNRAKDKVLKALPS